MQYVLPTYPEAKKALLELWPQEQGRWRCAICGQLSACPQAHHVHLSRRFRPAANDVRNLVPVCGPHENPDCHLSAHGGSNTLAKQAQYLVLGEGDADAGRQIVLDAVEEWGFKFHVYIEEVSE